MATILITGGSGLIGGHLTRRLQREGHHVRHLGRTPGTHNGITTYGWNIERGALDERAFASVDHIVHLSGAGIADKRWTASRMRALYTSRVDAALLLLEGAKAANARPQSFISASGIGYYGAVTSEHRFTESDPPATDTIGALTHAWEQAAERWSALTRVVQVRTPAVLAREGGALPIFARLARWGMLAPIGNGRQWMPWVHVEDLVEVYAQALRREHMSGPFNVGAALQPSNRDLMQAIARALNKPFFLPNVPGFVLRLGYGGLADLLLNGSRISTGKLSNAGVALRFQRPEDALRDLLG